MNTPTETEIKTAVNDAEQGFWELIAMHFPQVTTGDLDPLTSHKLSQTMLETVKTWLEANKGE